MNLSVFSNTFKTVASQNVTERTRNAKSIEAQLLSTREVLSGIFCFALS